MEINIKLRAKADSLVDKTLPGPRMKLSNLQTLILDGVETGVLLSDFAQQLRLKNEEVTDIYFTLLDAAGVIPTLVLNQNAKTRERASCIPFQIWTAETAKIVNSRCCCLWICADLSKASILSVSKVRQLLHSKTLYTKFTLTTRKFKRVKAFARLKIEIWCMDLTFVDELANKSCQVINSLPRLVWSNSRCKKDVDKSFQRYCKSFFNHDYQTESSQENLNWQEERVCKRV